MWVVTLEAMTTPSQSMPLDIPHDDRFPASIIREFLKDGRRADLISLAGGLPASELMPTERIASAFQRIVQAAGAASLQYGESGGEPHLLKVLSDLSGADSKRMLITNGSQQALSLCLAALHPNHANGSAGPIAAMEDPGYLGALQLLRVHNYDVEPIPVDEHGMNVDVLAERLGAGLQITVCYVNPTFQNPTGATLSPERGEKLLDLAEHYGFAVIADDPYRELYLNENAAPTALRTSSHLIQLGSMSKTLAPGLRLGWLTAEPELVDRIERAKQSFDLHTNTTAQLAAADLLDDREWWHAHLEGLRTGYRQRRDALVDALHSELPYATFVAPKGGFFVWLELPTRLDGTPHRAADVLTTALAPNSKAAVGFVPGVAFAADGSAGSGAHKSFLRLSYSHAAPEQFGEGIARLRQALKATK